MTSHNLMNVLSFVPKFGESVCSSETKTPMSAVQIQAGTESQGTGGSSLPDVAPSNISSSSLLQYIFIHSIDHYTTCESSVCAYNFNLMTQDETII